MSKKIKFIRFIKSTRALYNLQELYLLLNFDIIMIYKILNILVLFKNHLNYLKDSNFQDYRTLLLFFYNI